MNRTSIAARLPTKTKEEAALVIAMQSFILVNKITKIIHQSCHQREALSLNRLEQLKRPLAKLESKVNTTIDIMTLAKEEERDLKLVRRITG